MKNGIDSFGTGINSGNDVLGYTIENTGYMAEASGSRTHRRLGNQPSTGFEDHMACSDAL
jgi:hypothetical protein